MSIPRSGDADEGPNRFFAFRPGERLTFVLKWTFVPAGEAVLEVLPNESKNNPDGWHFMLAARSNAFVDTFYKVRDRLDSWTNADLRHSLRFRKKQHEGRTQRDVTVFFDWNAMTAQYQDGPKKRPPISIPAETFDPLALFYWFRGVPLKVGDCIQRPVTDGKKYVAGVATVIKKEKITVPAGTFDSFQIEPDLTHVSGVFEKSRDARLHLWVSSDSRRLPLKIKSKVAVGNFSGELVSAVGAAPVPSKTFEM